MKIRSAVLLACMLVVPALAMFSHRVPADVRAAVRAACESVMARWTTAAEPVAVAARVTEEPAPPPVAAPPAVVAPVTIPSTPVVVNAGDAEVRLRAAGASAVECRPVDGGAGTHVASCRVGLDATGQLVRVFHASGPDAASAVQALLVDVLAWNERVARREPPAGAEDLPAPERRF